MNNEQDKQTRNDTERRENEMSGSAQNRLDKIGETNVYPVSAMQGASGDAKIHDEASFGQGERGAKEFEDSGAPEVIRDEKSTKPEETKRNDEQNRSARSVG